MNSFSRRNFVAILSAAAAGTAIAPLAGLQGKVAAAGLGGSRLTGRGNDGRIGCRIDPTRYAVDGFGPIRPVLPNNTNDLGALAGRELLALPPGFEYTAISIVGSTLTSGEICPGAHDGMAAFPGTNGNYVLVRNHQRSAGTSSTGTRPNNGKVYDPFVPGNFAAGGTTTVVVDRQGLVVADWISLAGTIRNCAGGPTPWGSWISCEENTSIDISPNTKRHGYNFEVPASATEAVDPIPLVAMGRFNHEAVAVDPRTGYCYQTEDSGDSAIYRFVPSKRPVRAGDYERGGELYAMVIKPNQTGCDGSPLPTRGPANSVDLRGRSRGAAGSSLNFLGVPLAVEWVRLEDIDPAQDTLRKEAQAKGAAILYRGEGAWEHNGMIYWVNSDAGDAGEGQVMMYDPMGETVTMVVESTDENLLDGPDNITVGRDGTLYLCEDGSGGVRGEPNYGQRIVGVDADGGLFTFAHNNYSTSEFAGACFSQNGKLMYVNMQGSGITYAIWRSDNRSISLRSF